MEAIRSTNHQDMTNTLDDAMQVLFSKLDDAIDDVENGRVISEEELWEELAVYYEAVACTKQINIQSHCY